MNGIASIKGLGPDASVAFTGVTATIQPISADYSKSADIEELKDGEGNVVSKGATNIQQRVKLELLLTGADTATAKTLADPAPLAIVTLDDFHHAVVNGTWNYESGWSVKTGAEFAKISMELSRVGGAALTAAS